MATMASVAVNGSPMEIYIDAPTRSDRERAPAIVLMYHRDGLDDFTKGVAAKLAAAGYLVAVPDVAHRSSRDIPMADRKQFLKDSEGVADIGATVDFLRGRPEVAHEFHRYDNAGHGFQNRNSGTPGERAAAQDSWAKTLMFLSTVLGR